MSDYTRRERLRIDLAVWLAVSAISRHARENGRTYLLIRLVWDDEPTWVSELRKGLS